MLAYDKEFWGKVQSPGMMPPVGDAQFTASPAPNGSDGKPRTLPNPKWDRQFSVILPNLTANLLELQV
jgi:hypothetical protein